MTLCNVAGFPFTARRSKKGKAVRSEKYKVRSRKREKPEKVKREE